MVRIPVLVMIDGPLSGQRFPLQDGDGNTIGRSEECAITINDPDVSRQHARVLLHNDTVFVQDDNSRNGVFVNEKRVVRKPEELRPGGKIVIGEHVLLLELEDVNDEISLVIPIAQGDENNPTMMWVALGVLAVIAVALVLFLR